MGVYPPVCAYITQCDLFVLQYDISVKLICSIQRYTAQVICVLQNLGYAHAHKFDKIMCQTRIM